MFRLTGSEIEMGKAPNQNKEEEIKCQPGFSFPALFQQNQVVFEREGTLDLSFLSVERAREIYAKVTAHPRGHIIGTPWFPIRWPDGFNPASDSKEADLRET